ncbi:MAG: hypothetical protein H6858_08000 [Rhodospirillales bacterium]|nr:hypothetical protein [Rhodospirillales bacterium]
MFLNDPYRGEIFKHVRTPPKPLESFFYFITHCVLGQPVHRKDAGDEDTLGCILGDTLPSALKFAPHMERRRAIESRPEFVYSPNAPGIGLGGAAVTHPAERTKAIREKRKRPDDGSPDGANEDGKE